METATKNKQGKENPDSLVIMLHGWGANGADLISIADYWVDVLPDTLFIAPDAPEVCEQNPYGRQWFSLENWLRNRDISDVLTGAAKANGKLDTFLQNIMKEYKVPPEKVVLMGFSQGMMMAFYTGMRQKTALAGILGYSGAVCGVDEAKEAKYPQPPLCLIHGIADDVVPIALHHQAVEELTEAGYPIDSLEIPGLLHGIDPQGLQKGAEFLIRVLG